MFKFLSHEDDDVSGAVAKFAHDYLTLLKQIQPLAEPQKANVKNLLFVIVKKMKYDDSYGFDSEVCFYLSYVLLKCAFIEILHDRYMNIWLYKEALS